MKFLVAIVLLALVVAEAHHVPEHTLRGPRFKAGNLYKYEAVFNVTAGVLGMSSQVSASVLKADVSIYAKTDKKHVLKIERVMKSGSVSAIESKYGYVPMLEDSGLTDRLSSPITFELENGKVTKYTLSRKDNIVSRKIKKSILRSLEMHIPENILSEMETPELAYQPIMYNTTENTDYGVHISNYIITSSPDVEFPSETVVYNISRFDNCEGEWYGGYKLHHNFQKQGCPEVCRQTGEWKDNLYGAGCPSGFEPHHTPIKKSFTHRHDLSLVQGTLTPEVITTVEVHFAKMYDQDMEVLIRYQLRRTEVSRKGEINEEAGQEWHDDLNRRELEINEDEIDQLCSYEKSNEAIKSAKSLLTTVSKFIVSGEPTLPIGEKIILLREVLARLTLMDFRKVAESIQELKNIQFKSHEESVRRQVWLEVLPLVGTPESVKFIVEYMQKEISSGKMHSWEAKEMLEAWPQNIERPDELTVREIKKLVQNEEFLRKSPLLHSAVHICMGRIIGEACGNVPILRQEQNEKLRWGKSFQAAGPEDRGLPKCPEEEVSKVIKIINDKLERTRRPEEIIIYVDTLTNTGIREVLPVIRHYAHGTASNMQEWTPRLVDFTRSAVMHALHNIAGRYPEEVMEIVLPVYFNDTETPKVRNSAFGVLMRCQPSIAILQKVAVHSWFEKSREVGSFVTSTLETFGNSTLPCMQLLSHRIKEILPQLNRFDVGIHHAKNNMWSYFDDVRRFGLEGRFSYTPNNESFIPSTVYHALSYTIDSLRDNIYQSSINMEGMTQEKIMRKLIEYLDIKNIEPISSEGELFGEGNEGMEFIAPRTVEDFRLVTFQKLFYKTSYYYLDETKMMSAMREFFEFVKHYLRKRTSEYSGHLVKVYLPSSYHTIAIAKTLPFPVEFQMRQPIVFSVKVETDKSMRTEPTLKHFHLHLKPSLYLSKLFTHQMKNIHDCKEVGVYHNHTISMTYPFEIKYDGIEFPNVTFKYKVPSNKKRILYYHTEAGTYAGKKELESLPMNEDRQPILTLPSPFKFEKEINLVGLPPFRVEIHSEDMNLFHQKMPRTPTEVLHLAVKNILNAGWRYKSANFTIYEDRAVWTGENEATFKIEYNRRHVLRSLHEKSPQDFNQNQESAWNKKPKSASWARQPSEFSNSQRWTQESRQSDDDTDSPDDVYTDSSWWSPKSKQSEDDDDWNTESPVLKQWNDDDVTDSPWEAQRSRQTEDDDWSKYMKPTDKETMAEFSRNANAVTYILNSLLPHITHTLKVSVTAEPLMSTAYLSMEYNHTYEKDLHLFHFDAVSKPGRGRKPYQVNLRHVMAYFRKPNEMDYDKYFGKQIAMFRTAVHIPENGESSCPCGWENMKLAFLGYMKYKSLRNIMENELWKPVEEEYYLPETHRICLEDVRDGNPLSPNCLKAIREYSGFNKIVMHILWNKDLPYSVRQVGNIADVYLKHVFFEHLHLKTEENSRKRIDIEMNYIDKFVDEPVADWEIKKPSETVTLRRIPIFGAQPFSSIYKMHENLLMKVTNNTYPATCVLSKNYVQTYDMVTYPFTAEDCFYVLSTHCTEKKNFAVLVRGNKQIHIQVASNRIILTEKRGDKYTVKHNGRDVEVKPFDPVMFDEEKEIYAYIDHQMGQYDHIKVVAKQAGISVLYDGLRTVKVEVSPRYKGELCGLCSEFDGEEVREFRGMDRCLYRDYVDFAKSCMVKRSGRCTVRHPRDEKICDGTETEPRRRTSTKRGDEPTVQRNMVVYRGNEVCFSVRPLPACEEDVQPSETETQRIGFHCLPEDDVTARKLIEEAKRRPLDELRRKSVDHVQRVEVPTKC